MPLGFARGPMNLLIWNRGGGRGAAPAPITNLCTERAVPQRNPGGGVEICEKKKH
jgi:hypothetical protein